MNILERLRNFRHKESIAEDNNEDSIVILDCHSNDGTIQIGRTSLLNQSIHPIIRFDNADYDSIRSYLKTLLESSSATEDYYIRFLDTDNKDTWYHISKPEFLEIKKLDKSASLSDIVDKVNELVDEINNIKMRC